MPVHSNTQGQLPRQNSNKTDTLPRPPKATKKHKLRSRKYHTPPQNTSSELDGIENSMLSKLDISADEKATEKSIRELSTDLTLSAFRPFAEHKKTRQACSFFNKEVETSSEQKSNTLTP